jgi:hypothetical protein
MAFNSSALSAGLGSMLQGIQQTAQQKLQLAQMERQQRIENENLLHQRAMEDLARQGTTEQVLNTKLVNPTQRRILETQATLGERLLPSQVRGAELGVIGQDIANRSNLFNLNEILPQQKEGMFNANRISKVQGNIAEGTQDANITLAKQVPEGNKFTATTKLRAGFDDPLKTIQSALAVLNSPTMSLADKTAAYKEYNTARTTLAAMPGYVQSAEALPSLFGDTTGMRADYMKRLGAKEGETDMAAAIQRYAPERKAPTMADTLERYNIVPGIIQGVMMNGATNPSPDFIDRGNFKVDPVQGPSGTYKTPTLNTKRMAESLLPNLSAQITQAARVSNVPEMQLWSEGFGLQPKHFKNGKVNINDPEVKTIVAGKMAIGFIQNEKVQEALLRTNQGYDQTMQQNLSAYLASINKNVAKANIEATLKQLAYPLINNYTSAFEKANTEYNKILTEIRNVFNVDPKLATVEALIATVKDKNNKARIDQATRLIAERDRVGGVVQQSITTFADETAEKDVVIRASNAIKQLFNAGYAPAPTQSGGTTGAIAPPGVAPPAGGVQPGINANTPIAPATFVPRNQP